jgi:VWFA-related protein
MRSLLPCTLLLISLCAPAFSQQASTTIQPSNQSEAGPFRADVCAWLPSDIPHAAAVAGVCHYAMTLPQKMPNFICDQDASRFRGKNKVPFDLVTASVRYEDGKESFDNIHVNGKPAPATAAQSTGLWSTGAFGSNLRSIFEEQNHALFEFARDGQWHDHPTWIFTYQILQQNVPLWRMHGNSQVLAPPYKGELWVDQKTGELLRFGSVATDFPSTFPMAEAELQIDYANVAFPDGSSFVLPADFTLTTDYRGQGITRNVVQFRNCHKFRAKTRMLFDTAVDVAAAHSSAPAPSTPADRARQLEEEEQIYSILREQAVREDAAALELERAQERNAANQAAFRRFTDLQAETEVLRQENLAAAAQPEKTAAPSSTEKITVFKVSVKTVQVTVVLRDAKGHAVGTLRKEDFQLFDNGKPQIISSFSAEKAGAEKQGTDKPTPAASTHALLKQPELLSAGRDVAYVFDDIHTAFDDLASARDAAVHHLAALRPQDRAAIFTTSGQVGLNFTADFEKLQEALTKLRPHPMVSGPVCPPMTHYMADLIVNQDDRETLAVATQDAINCAFAGMAKSPAELARAEQVARSTAYQVLSASTAENMATLGILREVVQRTEAMPGSRSIVLVSPGFLTLTPETRQAIMELTDRALRSDIIVNTLDVRGLSAPMAAPNADHPAAPVERQRLDREEALARTDVMTDLAYSTGGTFFHNSNDLNEGFRRTADVPEYIYVLGFAPQKLDGKFHKLKVRLTGANHLEVQARQGYYALKPGSGS